MFYEKSTESIILRKWAKTGSAFYWLRRKNYIYRILVEKLPWTVEFEKQEM